MLTPEQQAEFVRERPDIFLPIPGGWGRMGMTHIRLAQASEDVLVGALRRGMAAQDRREHGEEEKEECCEARSKNSRKLGQVR